MFHILVLEMKCRMGSLEEQIPNSHQEFSPVLSFKSKLSYPIFVYGGMKILVVL